jgi:4-amino-4-deoxy-L-arabinose transferase-like glycosyltransferase
MKTDHAHMQKWFLVIAFPTLLFIFYILPLDHRNLYIGDDFAQYIQHARNICLGQSYFALPYPFNPEAQIGPPAYPPLLPLLISPLACKTAPDFLLMKGVVVFLFLLSLPVLYKILLIVAEKSLVCWSLFIYAFLPWIVLNGTDVGSDTPYMFFSSLALWLLITLPEDRPAVFQSLLTGLCMVLATLTRSIGIALLGCAILYLLFKNFKPFRIKPVTLSQLAVLSISFLIPLLAWKYYENQAGLAPANQAYFQVSMGLNNLTLSVFLHRLVSNFYYYALMVYDLLFPLGAIIRPIPYFNLLRFPIAAFFWVILTWQIVKNIRGPWLALLLYMACSLGILSLMEFSMRAGARYLIPMAPFLIYLILKGVKDFTLGQLPFNFTKASGLFIALWILLNLWGTGYALLQIRTPEFISASPEGPAYKNIVNHIQREISVTSRIAYIKPRYLSLYSQRPTAIPPLEGPPSKVLEYLQHQKVSYVLLDDHFIQDETSIRNTIKTYPEYFFPVYSNPPFILYRLKPA